MDYQIIINFLGETLAVAVPVGFIFAVTEKLCNLMFSMFMGKERINL